MIDRRSILEASYERYRLSAVMAGLVPAIHVFHEQESKTWMPGIRPGMTTL
jgi:hypothetical protein